MSGWMGREANLPDESYYGNTEPELNIKMRSVSIRKHTASRIAPAHDGRTCRTARAVTGHSGQWWPDCETGFWLRSQDWTLDSSRSHTCHTRVAASSNCFSSWAFVEKRCLLQQHLKHERAKPLGARISHAQRDSPTTSIAIDGELHDG